MAIETVDDGGQRVVQDVEAGPTAVLFTGGVTIDSLRVGDRVTLRAAPHRRGPGNAVLGLAFERYKLRAGTGPVGMRSRTP